MKSIGCTNNDITFIIGREKLSDAIKIFSVRTKEQQDIAEEVNSLYSDYLVCSGHEAFEIAQTILNDFRYYALEEDKVPSGDSLPF